MPLKVYIGDSNPKTPEIMQMEMIRKQLQYVYDQSTELCCLVIGTFIGDCEIDGIAIKKNGIVILELKNVEGRVRATWEEDETQEFPGGKLKCVVENPEGKLYEDPRDYLAQVRRQREKVISLIGELPELNKGHIWSNVSRFTAACVVLGEDSEIEVEGLPLNFGRWFSLATPSGAARRVELESRWLDWIDADVERFVKALDVEEVQTEHWMALRKPSPILEEEAIPDFQQILVSTLSDIIYFMDEIKTSPGSFWKSMNAYLRELLHRPHLEKVRLNHLDTKFESNSDYDIFKAIKTSIQLRLHQYTPTILKFRSHNNESIRECVVEAIKELDVDNPTAILVDYLSDESSNIRIKALDALCFRGQPSATGPLLGVLHGEDEDEVVMAIRVLGEIGDERAIKPLIALHGKYVKRFGESRFGGPPTREVISSLGSIASPKANSFIIDHLKDEDLHTRSIAVSALGTIRDSEAKEALISVAENDDEVRADAIYALSFIGGDDIARWLHVFLENEDRGIVETTVNALARIKSSESFEPVWNVYEKEIERDYAKGISHGGLSIRAEGALVGIDKDKMESRIIPMLKHKNIDLRRRVIILLSTIVTEGAITPLTPLLGDSDVTIWSTASYSIAKAGGESILPQITPLLSSKNEFERASAVSIIGYVKGEKGLEQVLPLAKDKSEDVRSSVVWVIGKSKSIEHIRDLVELSEDSSTNIRTYSYQTLEEVARETVMPIMETKAQDGTIPGDLQLALDIGDEFLRSLESVGPAESREERITRQSAKEVWQKVVQMAKKKFRREVE